MENSTYLPNPLTSPALMVLASTAEGHEGGRLPAPPHPYPSSADGKEMVSPYGNPPFTMYRPGDPFPPPMYSGVPHFVRPDRNMGIMPPVATSAFRPVSTDSESSYHSAFGPSAKKPKLEAGLTEEEDREEGSPRSSSSTHIKEERPNSINSTTNSEGLSDGGEFDRRTPDEGRTLRKLRKKSALDGQTPCCPICGLTLRGGEVDTHFALEVDRLEKIVRSGRRSRDTTPQCRKTLTSPLAQKQRKDSPSIEAASQSRYDTYMRIKCNRQSRLSARSRNRKKRPDETICPVCNDRVAGLPEELNAHVEICLKRKTEEDEPVDVEGDEQCEEYTWAGQTRIRATTLLQGGLGGSGFQTYSSRRHIEEDIDLDVDGDDSKQYGEPQYSEADIIPCTSEEPDEDRERAALRGAILGSSSSTVTGNTVSHADSDSPDEFGADHSTMDSDETFGGSASEVISALKLKIKDQEKTMKKDKSKCLICMEPYANPLTSIQCWHVHCEDCWLKTLGAKKLCPQCNMITAARDLRRIYL
ncbi:E3 ubiquitin-protein ligase Rnf220-like isoform X1 [Ostrea edulis]|nr:E3 ubiquitin-protein ligase Rnf220-like isoform X1 [Ostrea edulis]